MPFSFALSRLHIRALQLAGIFPDHVVECFKPNPDEDRYVRFRGMQAQPFSKKTKEERKAYEAEQYSLFADTITKVSCLISTLSKTADKDLMAIKKPEVLLIDECCQSTELETLLPLINNMQTVKLVIFLGDPHQLGPTVLTAKGNTETDIKNPCAPQLTMPYFTRMGERGFPVIMFTEQFRAAKGLAKLYSKLFYDDKIVDSIGTEDCPTAWHAVKWIDRQTQKMDQIPHIFFHVKGGVTIKDKKSASKYNPLNMVTTNRYIQSMVSDGIWQPQEITVITPYREQASRYRLALSKAGLSLVNAPMEIFTVDSAQGRENQCVIYDIVLAVERTGDIKFVRDPQRLNVAISHAQNMFIIVGDINLMEPNGEEKCRRAKMDSAEVKAREAMHKAGYKNTRKIFDYFHAQDIVYHVDAEHFQEIQYADLELVNANKAAEAQNNAKRYPKTESISNSKPKSKSRSKFMKFGMRCGGIDHSSR